MGYETSYWGNIHLSNEKIEKKIEQFIKDTGKDLDDYFEIEGIEVENKKITLGGNWKMYDEELEKFCLFIAKIDDKSSGVISCSGDDEADLWRIVIGNGRVLTEQGFVTYREDDEEFKNDDINKDVYKITKDKKLLKEIILTELDDNDS